MRLTAEDAGAYDEDGGGCGALRGQGLGFRRFWGRGHGWMIDGIELEVW